MWCGDDKYDSIAAASIIAKTFRDDLMIKYSKEYPEYNFDMHKGYPTKHHINALEKYGPSPIHRFSYGPVRKIVKSENDN